MSEKIEIDPDWLLEWLIDHSFVEKTEEAFSPYRIAVNPETDRPYTLKNMAIALNPRNKSSNKKTICREIKKCLSEHHIHYMSLADHAALRVELSDSVYTRLEEKFNLDLSGLSSHQRKTISAYYSRMRRKNSPDIDQRMRAYLLRRLNQRGDLRTGKRFKMTTESINEVITSFTEVISENMNHQNPVVPTRQTESLESILATSGALFNRFSNCDCYYDDHYSQSDDETLH